MNTIPNRIRAEATSKHGRIAINPDPDGCCATLKLGETWARSGRIIHCSRRHLPDNLFCGLHDHINALFGDLPEYLDRAFKRGRSLYFPDDQLTQADKALAELWKGKAA